MTAGTAATKTVLIADDATFVRERFQPALEDAGHRAVIVKSAAELLGRVTADLGELDLLVLDLRLPFASGIELVRAVRTLDRRPPAHPRLQRDDQQRGRGPGAGVARDRRLHQRVQRGAAHHAVARAPPVPRQLQPPVEPARRARHPGGLPVRRHHHGRAHAQPRQGRHQRAHDEPAPGRFAGQAPVPPARARSARSRPRPRSPGATTASGWGCEFERLEAADHGSVAEFVDGHFFAPEL